MASSMFLESLRQASLDQYYLPLSQHGITSLERLSQLGLQDYLALGVQSLEDRRQLFKLSQNYLRKKALVAIKGSMQEGALLAVTERALGSHYPPRVEVENRDPQPPPPVTNPPRPPSASVMAGKASGNRLSTQAGGGVPVSSAGLNAYGIPATKSASASQLLASSSFDQVDPALPAATMHDSTSASMEDAGERIKVCVRKRPLSGKEMQRGEKDIAEVASARTMVINEPK